ncbi:peptidyl-glycine alpha-amidating monooxygenase B-like isoform X2 [Macrobrachium nipponense]|uniref:peptidyl-glycine alpha-amidating monooxygenase B-like isoform X2 n=1 Tax=Macrobrachium nipponense TaxID=159736 RepID=UPI0030C831C6
MVVMTRKMGLETWRNVFAVSAALLSVVPQVQAYGHHFMQRGEPMDSATYTKTFTMPGVTPKVSDAYMCTAMPLNETVEEWVVKFDPMASASRAHHMLLFGCTDVPVENLRRGAWDCGHHGVCTGGRIMYAWAKNAPATHLPNNVGFRIGGQSGIRYLTLQIHYSQPLPDGLKDYSGLQMEVTTQEQTYKAGIYLLMAGFADIPPHSPKTNVDVNCVVGSSEPSDINLFAYRVHAHELGAVVTGYLYNPKTDEYTEIAKGNPHWPQAFYPMKHVHHVSVDDILHARCTYNSTSRFTHTYIGGTSSDEMCNLYLMYYTNRNTGSETGGCGLESFEEITRNLPLDSDVPLPPNPLLEEHAHGTHTNHKEEITYNTVVNSDIEMEKKAHSRKNPQPDNKYPARPKQIQYNEYDEPNNFGQTSQLPQGRQMPKDVQEPVLVESSRKDKQLKISGYKVLSEWSQKELKYGQVVAVALDSKGDVVVFHRGERAWDGSTFIGNKLRDTKTTISQPTLIHLNKDSGQIMDRWGENFFFVPHGLTLDKDDNIWVTDVGLHQVLKFPPKYGNGTPLLTLGTRFEPGSDDTHFCKPTGVAVLTSGEFFVSDGYCNSRIIKYSADGKILFQFGKGTSGGFGGFGISSPPPATFSIPHALTLAESQGELCVADRENGRVQCFTIEQGKFARQFKFDGWGSRLFSVSYTPAYGGKLFAVNGPQMFTTQKVLVFEVDFTSGELQGAFSPNNQGLSNPHDIVVSSDGADVFVAEIGPNNLWKFELESVTRASTKAPNVSHPAKIEIKPESLSEGTAKAIKSTITFGSKWSSAGVSTVVLGLLAVPIVVLTTLTLIIRARRNGRFRMGSLSNGTLSSSIRGIPSKHKNGLNLGSLLNKHQGFEKVATEDLDHDAPDSGDSDIEEFSQVATRA